MAQSDGITMENYNFKNSSQWSIGKTNATQEGTDRAIPCLRCFSSWQLTLQWILDMATQIGLLTPIGMDPVKVRTSLYVDGTALFLRLLASDLANLHQLLQQFGKVTRLMVNVQKSEIFSIQCDGINVSEILGQFQARQGQFPWQYLGLPLKLGRLNRLDEQKLVDKVAARLPTWKG
jgi:hypothetical protein